MRVARGQTCARFWAALRTSIFPAIAQQEEGGGRPGGRVDEQAVTLDLLARLSRVLSTLKEHPESRLAAHLPQLEKVVDGMWEAAPAPRRSPTLLTPGQMSPAAEAIAGVLRLNNVRAEDGFDMFDIDKDDKIGFADLVRAGETMKMDITKKDFQRLFQALGLGKTGCLNRLHTHFGYARAACVRN